MRGWYDVRRYSAVGDGATDDTSAVNAAIAAINAAGGGVLYFPPGTYKVTSALTTLTAGCTVIGCGPGAWGWDAGLTDAVSIIEFTSATATLFYSTAQFFAIEGLAVINTAGTTPTAGAAVHGNGVEDYHQKLMVTGCLFKGWYDTIDSQVTGQTFIDRVEIFEPVRYGIRVRNTEEVDSGGLHLNMSYIGAKTATTGYGVHIESAGGHKIVGLTTGHMERGISMLAAAASSIVLISTCSFEAYAGSAIYLDANGYNYRLVTVTGCEFGQFSNGTGNAIYIEDIDDIVIANNLYYANTGTPTAIVLKNGARAYVGPYVGLGFSTLVSATSFTTLDNDASGA